jgi:plastocyanin/predicted small secreted protein
MNVRHLIIIPVLIVLVCTLIAGCTNSPTGHGGSQNPVTPSSTVTAANTQAPVLSPGVTAVTGTVAMPVTPGPVVTLDLIAKKMAFNTSTISVPAGAQVVIRFQNQEASGSSQVAGIPHNFAVYPSPNSSVSIFSGAIITGGENITYTFAAPASPGTYYFRCDVHPTVMKGQFIVT